MLKKIWNWLDGKKRNIACMWWGVFVPAYGIILANGVHVPPEVSIPVGILGLIFTYVGLGQQAVKSQLAQKAAGAIVNNQAGEVDPKTAGLGAVGGVVAMGALAGLGISQGVIDINDVAHIALSKTEYVSAAALPAEALAVGAIKADSIDGIPVAVACDHTVMDEGGNTVQQISRPEFKSGHEFAPGNMLVYRVFEVDADGNEALVNIFKYPLSPRTDGQIYTVSDYPIINPNPPTIKE